MNQNYVRLFGYEAKFLIPLFSTRMQTQILEESMRFFNQS